MAEMTLDLTQDDPRDNGGLPDETFWGDDGNINLRLGETTIIMTYGQADRLFRAYEAWLNTVGADNPYDVNGFDYSEHSPSG